MDRMCIQISKNELLDISSYRNYLRHGFGASGIVAGTVSVASLEVTSVHFFTGQRVPNIPTIVAGYVGVLLLLGIFVFCLPYIFRKGVASQIKKVRNESSEKLDVVICQNAMILNNCAEFPFGTSLSALKKRTIRKKPDYVVLPPIDRIYMCERGVYFAIMWSFYPAFFISRETISQEDFDSLCQILKASFGSRFNEMMQ